MTHTLAALRSWGVTDKELPTIETIKHIHVYDFDNTLFASPLPNPQLWQGPSIGQLQTEQTFVNGGWWHDPNILACTGEGLEKEEAKAWEGWWNEQITTLVELTMQQKDALCVLLTGRSEKGFTDIIQRMVNSKKLDFHLISLRPQVGPSNEGFASTAKFKQALLEVLIRTYTEANEIRIYEDRPKHVVMFRDFFRSLNQTLSTNPTSRKPINAEVVEVAENERNLDPVAEVAEVQRMINSHNTAFKNGELPRGAKSYQIGRTVLYTGYLISPDDTAKLLAAADLKVPETDVRTLANNVLITPRPCPEATLAKVGGIGKKMKWRTVAVGVLDNRVWAARVEPVPVTERYHCENPIPAIVLAVRRNSRPHEASRIQNWIPLSSDNMIEIDTVVGEKVLLRIDEEVQPYRSQNSSQNKGFKRAIPHDEEFPALGSVQPDSGNKKPPGVCQQTRNYSDENRRGQNGAAQGFTRGGLFIGQQRGRGNSNSYGRGGRGGRGGQQRGGGGRGRGRGGYGPAYRSLDDAGANRGGRGGHGMDGASDDRGLTY